MTMENKQAISQKEYLKRYLSNDKDDKKKKKKRKVVSSSTVLKRSQIIDDDIDLKNMRVLDDDEVELYQLDEDAPQIAGIVDERPPEVQAMEYYGNSKRWKVFGDDGDGELVIKDNFESDLRKEGKSISTDLNSIDSKNIKKLIKENKNLGVQSLPTARKKERSKRDSDSDVSLPRKPNKSKNNSDSDMSPPRKSKNDNNSDLSPPRKSRKSKNDSDSDISPPRKSRKSKNDSNSDISPPRKSRKSKNDSDSDLSPPRKSRKSKNDSDSDLSPPRKSKKSKYDSNSDLSPPRKSSKSEGRKNKNRSDSDLSPPRRSTKSPKRKSRKDSDSDLSPPRNPSKHSIQNSRYSPPPRKTHYNQRNDERRRDERKNDQYRSNNRISETSKSRVPDFKRDRRKYESSDSDANVKNQRKRRDRDHSDTRKQESTSNNSSRNKMEKTLDGKRAGLQDAKQLKNELADFKRREDQMFSKLNSELSGKDAEVIRRDRKTGQRRDIEKERREAAEKAEKSAKQNEKYSRWGKGLKQVEDASEKLAEALHEMSKPLARYADDDDLDKYLKAQEREGDPMLDYIRKKQKESISLTEVKPLYKGSFLPNRFGIRPGYRWDGVDRSNGYEKQWFSSQNSRKARDEEAYKWSVSDM